MRSAEHGELREPGSCIVAGHLGELQFAHHLFVVHRRIVAGEFAVSFGQDIARLNHEVQRCAPEGAFGDDFVGHGLAVDLDEGRHVLLQLVKTLLHIGRPDLGGAQAVGLDQFLCLKVERIVDGGIVGRVDLVAEGEEFLAVRTREAGFHVFFPKIRQFLDIRIILGQLLLHLHDGLCLVHGLHQAAHAAAQIAHAAGAHAGFHGLLAHPFLKGVGCLLEGRILGGLGLLVSLHFGVEGSHFRALLVRVGGLHLGAGSGLQVARRNAHILLDICAVAVIDCIQGGSSALAHHLGQLCIRFALILRSVLLEIVYVEIAQQGLGHLLLQTVFLCLGQILVFQHLDLRIGQAEHVTEHLVALLAPQESLLIFAGGIGVQLLCAQGDRLDGLVVGNLLLLGGIGQLGGIRHGREFVHQRNRELGGGGGDHTVPAEGAGFLGRQRLFAGHRGHVARIGFIGSGGDSLPGLFRQHALERFAQLAAEVLGFLLEFAQKALGLHRCCRQRQHRYENQQFFHIVTSLQIPHGGSWRGLRRSCCRQSGCASLCPLR